MPSSAESFIEEMKRYIGLSADDAALLASLAPLIEPHLPALAERFYEQIPHHSSAATVFAGGDTQIARLKRTLQDWARGLFSGVYDEAYAQERFRIGYRHVQIQLPQRYVISAMHVVDQFLRNILEHEVPDPAVRRLAHESLSRIINLDLNLICETYFEGSLRELRTLNDDLTATNNALERASRAKTEFLAMASHELRTPLTSIIGFSKLLASDAVPDSDTKREFARDIHASSLALLGLVDEILDVARIEAGKFDVQPERTDILALVEEAIGVLKLELETKGLTLTTDVACDLPPARADRARLRQVIINILGNAVKFTSEGGVSLTATADMSSGCVTIAIADTGIGIAPEHQRVLFQKFRQVDASYTRRRGGLGLGLAISKALVERMGGSIALGSEGLGKGTTVTLTVPLADVALSERGPVTRPSQQLPTVIVVAEEPRTRKRIASMLVQNGYAVREGATADGTRAMVRQNVPDVLLLDLSAASEPGPVREWIDLLLELKREAATRGVEVLVVTDGVVQPLLPLQIDVMTAPSTVLQKPTEAEVLQMTLERLGGPRTRPQRILVADDDPLIFRFVQQLLPSPTYTIEHAAGGTQAVAMLHSRTFDVLLLDLRMPDGSGYEVLRRIKVDARLQSLPIIVITNFPQPETEEERDLLGVQVIVDLLPKTAVAERPELLLNRLEQLRSAR